MFCAQIIYKNLQHQKPRVEQRTSWFLIVLLYLLWQIQNFRKFEYSTSQYDASNEPLFGTPPFIFCSQFSLSFISHTSSGLHSFGSLISIALLYRRRFVRWFYLKTILSLTRQASVDIEPIGMHICSWVVQQSFCCLALGFGDPLQQMYCWRLSSYYSGHCWGLQNRNEFCCIIARVLFQPSQKPKHILLPA